MKDLMTISINDNQVVFQYLDRFLTLSVPSPEEAEAIFKEIGDIILEEMV